MRFGSLLITFLLLSWIQFSSEKSEYLEVWKPEVNLKCFFIKKKKIQRMWWIVVSSEKVLTIDF